MSKAPNYDVLKLLANVQGLVATRTISWVDMMQRPRSSNAMLEHELRSQAADAIAHQIAGYVYGKGTETTYKDAAGFHYKLSGYWLRYDELVDLLDAAYNAGVHRLNPILPDTLGAIKHDPSNS